MINLERDGSNLFGNEMPKFECGVRRISPPRERYEWLSVLVFDETFASNGSSNRVDSILIWEPILQKKRQINPRLVG